MGFNKISELDPAASVNDSDLFAGVQEENNTLDNKKYTAEQLKLYFQNGTQPELIFDDVPVENSNNPVKSGGLYSEFATKQDVLTFDAMPTDGSSNPVTSDGIEAAIASSEARSIPLSQKGEAGGVAELDSSGKVLSSQLPSYVDDVEEYLSRSAFPVFGEGGKIYIALDTSLTYRWTGSGYAEISPSLALGETSSTAYRGDRGKTAYDFSQSPYTSAPAMDGAASAGSSSSWARGDHVHPKDTSKQDVLTFDNIPTENSSNPVKSGGVYSAIQDSAATKQDILTFDDAPTASSSNPVKSNGIYSSLQDMSFLFASPYSQVSYYNVGQYTLYDGQIYRCIIPATAEPFDSTKWVLITIGSEIEFLRGVRPPATWDERADYVRRGIASRYMSVGDPLSVKIDDINVTFDLLDYDYDTPVDEGIPHTMTLAMKNCYTNIQFDAQEALIFCPDGLEVGTRYYITLDHGSYNGGTAQDGDYGFTPTQAVPAGGYVRHTTMGMYRSGSYTKAQITDGKFVTYGTDFAQIEQLATDEGTEGVYLGKATGNNPAYLDSNYPNVNFTERNACGSSNWETSNLRQYLNSVGTGWWVQKTKWSFPPANVATLKGFLTGIDPALRENMKTVKKRVATSVADRPGGTPLYKDVEDKVFLLSQTEVNLGANNSQYETSFGLDNTLKTVPYAYYNGAADADRIKLLSGTPSHWWLRGPDPGRAGDVRRVFTSGSISGDYARNGLGLVVGCVIG